MITNQSFTQEVISALYLPPCQVMWCILERAKHHWEEDSAVIGAEVNPEGQLKSLFRLNYSNSELT